MNLFFLDIETNSESLKFDRDTHEIIQIWIYNPQTWEKFSQIINIWKPLSENIKRLTWITDDEILNWIDLHSALENAIAFLWDKNESVIVWHNLENFDLYILSKFDKRFWEYRYLDTLHLFLFLYPGFKSYSVQDLYRKFISADYSEDHQALQDAIDEHELFEKVLNKTYLEQYYGRFGKNLWFVKDILNKYDWSLNPLCYDFEFIKSLVSDINIGEYTWLKSKLLDKRFFNYDLVNTPEEEADIFRSPDPSEIISTDEMDSIYDDFLSKTWNSKRDDQLSMMQHSKDILNWDEQNLFIEAWTWTWKTYGYLLPSISYFEKNRKSKKLKIFIATYTKVLQEQLMDKDIPLLKKLYPNIRFELLKADSEWISLDLVPFKWPLSFWNVLLWNWLYRGYFHLSDIHFSIQLKIWFDNLSLYHASLPLLSNYDRRYWYKWKLERQLRDWNIFIINQAFLVAKFNPIMKNSFTDLVATKDIPSIRVDDKYYAKFIIDEWHNLESVIREYLTLDFTKLKFDSILSIFSKVSNFNIINYVNRYIEKTNSDLEKVGDDGIKAIKMECLNQLNQIKELFEWWISWEENEMMHKLYHIFLLNFPKTKFCNVAINDIKDLRSQWYDTTISEYDKKSFVEWYNCDDLVNFLNYSQDALRKLLDEVSKISKKETAYVPNFLAWFYKYFKVWAILANREYTDKNYFFNSRVELFEDSLELKNFGFTAIPLYLSNWSAFLNYSKWSVVLSATLFDKWKESYVLKEVFWNEYNSARIQKYKTPFDYVKQRNIFCINTSDQSKIDKVMDDYISRYMWRTLILTNTTAEKRRLAQYCKDKYWKQWVLTLMHTWWSMASSTNQKNVQCLRDNPNTILVWSKSYAEWVDVPWDNLKLVILNKLPFLPPTPFTKYQDKKWKSKWDRFVYKFLCSINFRQSIWRLIRTKSDTWDILVLDERLLLDSWRFFRDYIEWEKINEVS